MAVRDVVQAAAGVGGDKLYVEDVFSTYLYTGNSSTQTITNGIDLDGEGGLVWLKWRSGSNAFGHALYDSERGITKELKTQTTGAQSTENRISSFNSSGFTLTSNTETNYAGDKYASWSLRKSPKFFDVVTWTGNDAIGRQIPHSLGSVPGCIIVKATSRTSNWAVYHRSIGNNSSLFLNNTDATTTPVVYWNSTNPTSTEFTIGDGGQVNENGQTYVAYVFAHDAGGFGDDGEQNVISCGSFTTDGSGNATVNLGWEPQWAMFKCTSESQSWFMSDDMRGMPVGSNDPYLVPNTSAAEATYEYISPTATGFTITNQNPSATYIYIAIRRGPMKTPESGTEVFSPVARSGTGATATVTNNITTDLIISQVRNTSGTSTGVWDRLRGFLSYLETTGTAAESTSSDSVTAMNNTAYVLGADGGTDRINRSGYTYANWTFSRAPGFFDVVAYTGTGAAHTEAHNLGVAPELMIVKDRSVARNWVVYHSFLTATSYRYLNSSSSSGTTIIAWNNTEPTASNFTTGVWNTLNGSGETYVAYLFATLDGVSKVGSYTGTGADLNVDCGFATGARFILIRRTDADGDWYVWDSVRGIVSGNDPYLLLNSTAAEVTSTDYIDPLASGFTVTSSAPAALNASGGSYIFLAIA